MYLEIDQFSHRSEYCHRQSYNFTAPEKFVSEVLFLFSLVSKLEVGSASLSSFVPNAFAIATICTPVADVLLSFFPRMISRWNGSLIFFSRMSVGQREGGARIRQHSGQYKLLEELQHFTRGHSIGGMLDKYSSNRRSAFKSLDDVVDMD